MKIKGREVNHTFRQTIESGKIIVNAKGKDWEIPYEYSEKTDTLFDDYDKDLDFTLPKELEKSFDEDTIDNLKEEIEERFNDLKII